MSEWSHSIALDSPVLDSFGQGPPATRLQSADLCMGELSNHEKLMLQVKSRNASVIGAVNSVLGLKLPTTPNTSVSGHLIVLWMGPGKWLIVLPSQDRREVKQKLEAALSGVPHLISDYGAARAGIEVSGPKARTVLARVCPLDLHPNFFRTGQCAQSLIARAPLLLYQADDLPVFHLYIDRSLVAYAWAWLSDAAREFTAAASKA